MYSKAYSGGAIGSVAVRAAWLRWSAILGSRPRLAGSLCQVIVAYALRQKHQYSTESLESWNRWCGQYSYTVQKDGQSRSRTKTELRPWKCGFGEKCWEFHGGSTGQTSLSLKNLMWKENSWPKWSSWRYSRPYFGHVAKWSAGQLALTVLEGSMEGTRYQGKPKRQWLNDIEDWTGYKYI